MTKAAWISGALILIIALGGAYFFSTHQSSPAPAEDKAVTGNAAVGANGASTVITYTDSGFLSSPQTISPGTTVTWVNQSSHKMWVQTRETTGTTCEGAPDSKVLNECQAVGTGGTYSYTFTVMGTFSYVNHEQNTDTGVIIVTDSSSSGHLNPGATPQ